MSRHRRCATPAPLLLGLLVLAAVAAGADAIADGRDELWRRAVSLVAANDRWTAGIVELQASESDGSDRLRSSWEVSIRAVPGPDGRPVQEIRRYLENGRDVTQEKRREGERRERNGDGGGPFSWNPSDPRQTPFHPSVQGEVSARRRDGLAVRDGRSCAVYAFEQRLPGRSRAVGTAWLDAATGAPVALEATLEPLPLFVSRAEIEVSFESGADGSLKTSAFHVKGEATILFVRRAYDMALRFSEHWLLPAQG